MRNKTKASTKASTKTKSTAQKIVAAMSRLNVEKDPSADADVVIHKSWQRLLFWGALVLALASFGLFVFLLLGYLHEHQDEQQVAIDLGSKQSKDAAGQISSSLDNYAMIARTLAGELSDGSQPYTSLDERLENEMRIHPDLPGITVAFAPGIYDTGNGQGDEEEGEEALHAPYYSRDANGVIQRMQLEELYDYTLLPREDGTGPDTTWYHQPMAQGDVWLEPYLGSVAKKLLSGYGVPFYAPESSDEEPEPVGVVVVDLPLSSADALMDSLDLGSTGYGYILSKEGLFIAHPVKEYIGTTTIFKLSRDLRDKNLRDIGRKALLGEAFLIETVDNVTGQEAWIFHEPIAATGWTVGVVLYKDEFAPNIKDTIGQQTRMALVLLMGLFFTSIVAFGAQRGGERSLWSVATSVSLLCIVLIGFVWYLAAQVVDERGVMVVNKSSLNRFLTTHAEEIQEQGGKPPIYIPTGVMVQTIQFAGPNDVTLGGYIWQKYPADLDESIIRGFVFPQQGGWDVIHEETRFQEGNFETIRWKFLIPLRQPFNPFKYPFDNEDILMRLRHPQSEQNVMLVPDLDSYDLIKPDLLPGLDDEVVIEGRLIDRTFFSFRDHVYNANLGVEDTSSTTVPELYFNISIHRDFVDSLVGHVIPIVVVLLMMFIVMLITHEPDPKEVFSVLSYAAALFFVAAIAHSTLRDSISATGIIYFEYFYIMIYLVILAASANSIIYNTLTHIRIIQYRNNLLPKLLYGPVVLGILAIITLQTYVFGLAEQATGVAEESRPFKIGLVTSVAGLEDGRLNEKAWAGLEWVAGERDLSIEIESLVSESVDAYEANITQFADEDYDMIVTVGQDMAESTYRMAAAYPGVVFVLVDSPAKRNLDNVQGIVFHTDETGVAAGYLAAFVAEQQDSDDPVVGYVAAEQKPFIERTVLGYSQGIKLYNAKHMSTVGFTGVYVGAFDASDEGNAEGLTLIDEGADILLAVGGTTGDGALTAASTRGKPGVGMDVDQFESLVDLQNALVTSNVKYIEQAIFEVVEQTIEDGFAGGTDYVGTLANGGVSLAPFHAFTDSIPSSMQIEIQEVEGKVIAGELWTGQGEIGGAPAVSNAVSSAGTEEAAVHNVTAIVSSDQARVQLSQQVPGGAGKLFMTLEVSSTNRLAGKEFVLLDTDEHRQIDMATVGRTLDVFIDGNKIVGDDGPAYTYYSGTLTLQTNDTDPFVVNGLKDIAGGTLFFRSYYLKDTKELTPTNLLLVQQVRVDVDPALKSEDATVITIGVLQSSESASLDEDRQGLQEGLKDIGYDGKDVQFDIEYAEKDPEKAKFLVESFVEANVDMIYSLGTLASQACVEASEDTPIVFSSVTDPLGAGLVESMARPGGLATGLTDRSPFAEQIALVKDVLPDIRKLGVVYNPSEQNAVYEVEELTKEAEKLDIEIVEAKLRGAGSGDVATAVEELVGNVDAIHIPADNTVFSAMDYVAEVCTTNQVPLFVADISYVSLGAVAALSVDSYELGYQASGVVDRVLTGEDPADIPVETAERLQLWVNPVAAETQGVTIPEAVMQRADHVHEDVEDEGSQVTE